MNQENEPGALTEDQLIQVNQICNAFEKEWCNGRQPRVEELLGNVVAQDVPMLLRELLPLEAEYRLLAGKPLRIEECQSRFPDVETSWLEEVIEHAAKTRTPLPRGGSDAALDLSLETDNYKILDRIGEGGFGIVYRAEQRRPVRRLVALKVVKPGMDSKQILARFEAERQALAIMEHPNIASILDAGITEEGRPYFVMELVRGVPITEYCDEYRLTVDDRLGLFVRVCQAVQHAHQKGVIHRDIKPSNILVSIIDGLPEPKIIDFGVAKAINQRLTEATLHTGFAQMLGTPLYMSPEQAEMSVLDVDTRTDIFALGVLLYELLTGSTPIEKNRLAQASFDEVRRLVREDEPPLPSTRLSTLDAANVSTLAQQRRLDARQFARAVRGDLDWIIMKAMEKDRTRRYPSASALAEDVKRHLDNRPVEAGAPSVVYRLGKFTKRHRGPLLVVGTVIASLIVSTIVSLRQAAVATIARQESEVAGRESQAVVEFLVDTFRRPDPSVDGRSVTVAELLDRAVASIPDRFPSESREKASMLHAIGETYLGLGLPFKATAVLEDAFTIRKRVLGENHDATIDTSHSLALAYSAAGRLDEATQLAEAGLDTLNRGPVNAARRIQSMQTLAELYRESDQQQNALEWERRIFHSKREELGGHHPQTLAAMEQLAKTLGTLGKHRESFNLLEESAEIRRQELGPEHPDTLGAQSLLANAYWTAGLKNKSLELDLESLATSRSKLGAEHPDNFKYLWALANHSAESGDSSEALAYYQQVLEIKNSEPRKLITYNHIGNVQQELGLLDAALESYRLAVEGWRVIDLPNESRLNVLHNYAQALGMTGAWNDAAPILEEQVRLEDFYASDRASYSILRLGTIYAWQGNTKALSEHGDRLLEAILQTDDSIAIERFVKPFLVHSISDNSKLMRAVEELIQRINVSESSYRSLALSRGLSEYRLGNYEHALAWLKQAEESAILSCRLPSMYVRALAQHGQGQLDLAQSSFDDAEELASQLPPRDSKDWDHRWHDYLICFLIQDEATTALGGVRPDDK